MKWLLAAIIISLVLIAGCGQADTQQKYDAPLGIEKTMAQNEQQQKNVTPANVTLVSRMVTK